MSKKCDDNPKRIKASTNRKVRVEQCFSTFFKSRNLWHVNNHLAEPKHSKQNYLYSFFKELSKALVDPLGSAEHGFKNTEEEA